MQFGLRGVLFAPRQSNVLPDPSLEELEKAFDLLVDLGVTTVNISGGEPFLRNDLIDILAMAKDKFRIESINVLTNGTIVEEDLLIDCAPYISTLSISFDGASPQDSAEIRGGQLFDKLISCVKMAQKAGIAVCVTPTIHAKNWRMMRRYRELADDIGAELNYSILSSTSVGWEGGVLSFSESDLRSLANEILQVAAEGCQGTALVELLSSGLTCRETCGSGSRVLSIDADGEVYPCHLMHDDRFGFGNVFRGDAIQPDKSILPPISEECLGCEYRYLCGGGCRARALGLGREKDPYCVMHKEFYARTMEMLIGALEKQENGNAILY